MAITLVVGPTGPVFAGFTGAPASDKEGAAVQPVAKKIVTAKAGQIKRAALPLYFEANSGQTDASVKYFTRAGDYNLYLTGSEAVMVMPRTGAAGAPEVVRMKLNGANKAPSVQGLELLPGYSNYLIGSDPAKWHTKVQQYSKVKLAQVYPGIDMVYRFNKGQVEYDFVVAPGASPWRILLGFEGAKDIRLDAKGDLVLRTDTGELTYKAPELYQKLGTKKVSVKGRFVLASNKSVRLEVGNYVKSKELIIDPALAYSSFLGGTVDDKAYAVAVDAAGNAYLTGSTLSTPFPGVGGHYQTTLGGLTDVFVTKVNPAGSAVVWSTYYGGAGVDIGLGIGVDATGIVYVSGSTTVTIPNRTHLFGPGGGTDAFVAAFSASGTSLVYADQFGGGGEESANGIAVDAAGNAYVTGHTTSMAINSFPIKPAGNVIYTVAGVAQAAGAGGDDAFVAKFDAAGNQVYATYLGGTGSDHANAIAIDGTGNAYVTGECEDAFPITPLAPPTAFKTTITGSDDAFITKVNPVGSSFLYSTYVGGSGIDEGTGIALDSSNNIYITGYTFSADFPGASFVTVGQTTIGTAPDAFVFKLNTAGGGGILDGVYATYLGASGDDRATSIAVDAAFNAYITGVTFSGDFPMVGPISGGGTLVGAPEAFVAQIGPTGGTVGFSTYLGGTTMTGGQGITLDSSKSIYVTGWTNSDAATFPLLTPFQAANAGSFDAFISKFGPITALAGCTITGINPVSGFMIGGTTVTITGTGFTGITGPNAITFDGVNASTYTAASATTLTAVTPRHPLTGTLTPGTVPLTVKSIAGFTCSSTYKYVASPTTDTGACGEDFFFPSPATGATAQFAFCMARPGTAKIRVYNVIGDIVFKSEEERASGANSVILNTSRLAPGVYLYRLEKNYDNGTSTTSSVKKFVVKH